MSERVSVRYNRRIAAAGGVLALVAVALCARRAAVAASVGELAVLLCAVAAFGALCVFYLRRAIIGRVALSIDDDGVTVGRSGLPVRWDEIGEVYLRSRQGLFNEYHHLVISQRAGNTDVTQPIDQLDLSWKEIVEIIEARAGRRVHVRRVRAQLRRHESA